MPLTLLQASDSKVTAMKQCCDVCAGDRFF
jgi:hypothetical protein